jgi:hypothetical protein
MEGSALSLGPASGPAPFCPHRAWSYTGTRYTSFSSATATIKSHVKLPVYNTLKVQAGVDNGHYSAELFAKF